MIQKISPFFRFSGKSSFLLLLCGSLLGLIFFSETFAAEVPAYPVYQQAIGGVSLDADGVLANTPEKEMTLRREALLKNAREIPADLNQTTALRKISLKKLDLEIRRCIEQQAELSEEVRYLAGLTSIRYVVPVPEENDILLVGTGEGWTFDKNGTLVGKNSGRPVFLLEDLITLMRVWKNPRPEPITCSIDPTQEALLRVAALNQKVNARTDPKEFARELEIANGLNTVKITGISPESRIARIMTAADYKLKQLGLGLEGAPKGFPSYLTKVARTMRDPGNPRFWLAPDYGSISHDVDRLTWDLGQSKVKVMTETDYIDSLGKRTPSGNVDRTAQLWAETMTKDYSRLCKADSVFADVKNCMDLAVAVALIYRENLLKRSECNPSTLWERDAVDLPRYEVPKQVRSTAIIEKRSRGAAVGCGGVEIDPWTKLETTKLKEDLSRERTTLISMKSDQWWSN